MAFANFSVLAFGSLLMGVPILLHLMMKRKPRHQLFPAMRFLQQRQVANQRQMRLRHWLLLALRIAAIGLLATLFARPSVDSATSGYWTKALFLGVLSPFAIVAAIYCWSERKGTMLLAAFGAMSIFLVGGLLYFGFLSLTSGRTKSFGDEHAPVAAALVFDTSPRMGLLYQNRTRLEEAQQVARDLLKQLPTDSEVAIIDASGPGIFSVDIGNAVSMVESLRVLGYEYSLADLVRRGIDLVAKRDDKRQEVYVLTDLSDVVWDEDRFQSVKSRLEDLPDLSLFVLDVGAQQPQNVQLGELQLSANSLAVGQTLRIESDLRLLNVNDKELTVDVSIEKQDPTRPVIVDDQVLLPESVTRRRIPVELQGPTEVPVVFEESSLPPGVHHGLVKISSQDGLKIDDQRFFTIEVRPPLRVLLVVSQGAESWYVEQAISPTEFRERGQNAFDCHLIRSDDLLSESLEDYSAIALLDPDSLPAASWQRLEEYARKGGGIALMLGRNASPTDRFNAVASNILPGQLGSQWRVAKDDVLQISLNDTSHPMMSLFRGREKNIPWDSSPIFRHWHFSELDPGANVIVRFSNNQPAMVESVIGKGRVLTLTTPVSDRRRDASRPAWNYLPTSEYPLPFFMLMNGLFPYLTHQSGTQWNHQVGEAVDITLPGSPVDATWQLFTPQLDWQNLRSEDGKLVVTNTNAPGHYRLKLNQDTSIGFSANLPAVATNVKRQDVKQLDAILGKSRFTLARGTKELSRGIGQARIGRELFPFLMLCVVGILAMEHLVSNRFYGPPQ